MSFWCCAQLEHSRVHLGLHCLRLAGFDTYAPRLRTHRVSRGRKIAGLSLLFPSYVFVYVVAQWYAARWSPGVIRLVMAGDARPARVPDTVITELRAREGGDGLIELPRPPGLKRGDVVRVIHGPLQGLLGLYAGMKPRARVEVFLRLLGDQQRVELAANAIEPAEARA
jgi:transcriptional antiterminator RfaH